VDFLLKELGVLEYTREHFVADRARLIVHLCAKHSIAESEVDALIGGHNYAHSAEDPEEEYIEVMALGRGSGWA
jgi:hypothetical protein